MNLVSCLHKWFPMMFITNYRDFYWPTSDDWYSNWYGDQVRVRLNARPIRPEGVLVMMTVWGNDDTGMERKWKFSKNRIDKEFEEILVFCDNIPSPITKAWLKENGFVNA